MLSNLLKEDLQRGYNLSCKELQDLILYRLNTPAIEIFEDLFDTERELVDEYCLENRIDLAQVLMKDERSAKTTIALDIIEASILKGITDKKEKDKEIRGLGLKCFDISNKIEEAPWLKLFNSPLSLQWWTKNTDVVIKSCPEELLEHPGYKKMVRVVEAIKNDWIKPGEVIPNIEDYNQLKSLSVPPEVQEVVTKLSGN